MMKRTFSTIILLPAFAATTCAQTLNIQTSGVTYQIPASEAGDMVYSNGETLTVMGKTLSVSDISKMYVDDSEVSDNSVSVTYNGTEACVTISGNVARYVSASVSGAHVSLTQSDDVSDDTCGEITYSLSGASSDGAFTLTGSYKASIELNGLSLTNPSGAAIDIQDGKRIAMSVKKGTENTLTDGTGGSQKGCITCKGHLEMKGKGTLNVYGNTAHGVFSKEYFSMKNCTLNVLSAVKDGINCNQYFLLESGALTISGVGDDGVQASYKDDTDRETEDTGALTISGGTVNISVSAAAAKGMKCEGLLSVSGGDITVTTSGNGTWDSDEQKTKASSCLSSDADILISGGTLSLTSTGAGGKGINGDGTLTITDGDITVKTSGGLYAYVSGKEYTNYTGSTDRLGSDYKSSPKGMKIDGNVTISGGTINVTTTGNGGEGIESKAVLTITGGTIVGNAYDDVINSGSHMYIKGGDITVVASNNDGLDANGNMYIQGGTIRAFGTSAPECGIDANEEDGYSVFFTGGTLLAVGGGNSVPSSSLSTQAYVSGNLSVTSGGTVTLTSGSTTLASFTVPTSYSSSSSSSGGFGGRMGGFGGQGGPGGNQGGQGGPGGGSQGGSSVLITCAGLTSGSSYTLSNGSSSTTVTAKK